MKELAALCVFLITTISGLSLSLSDDVIVLRGKAVFDEPVRLFLDNPKGDIELKKGMVLYQEKELIYSRAVRLKEDFKEGEGDSTIAVPAGKPFSVWLGNKGETACYRLLTNGGILACFSDKDDDGAFESVGMSNGRKSPTRVSLVDPIEYENVKLTEADKAFGNHLNVYHRRLVVKKISKKSIKFDIESARPNGPKRLRKFRRVSKAEKKIKVSELPVTLNMAGLQVHVSKGGNGNIIASIEGEFDKAIDKSYMPSGYRIMSNKILTEMAIVE